MTLKESSRIPWNAKAGDRFHVSKLGLDGKVVFDGTITEIPSHRRFAVVTYGGVRECWPMTPAPGSWKEPASYLETLGPSPAPRGYKPHPEWQGSLKARREEAELTLEEVARRAGISVDAYRRWERDETTARLGPMVKVFPELACELAYK